MDETKVIYETHIDSQTSACAGKIYTMYEFSSVLSTGCRDASSSQ